MTDAGPSSHRIVVIDPDPAVAASLERSLARGAGDFTVRHVSSEAELSEGWMGAADGVVCEYDLPGADGIEVLSTVRAADASLPFVLYTDVGGEIVASDAIAAGVSEYVSKEVHGIQMVADRLVERLSGHRQTLGGDRTERVNEVFRRVDMALVRADSRREIEQAVCDILAESEPYLFTWIGEYVPEHDRLLPRAHAGIGADFLDEIPVGEGTTLPDSGPGPAALRTGAVQVTQNVGTDPAFDEFREEVDSRGYRSVATVPLVHDQERYGLLAIYADRPNAFDAPERALLESLGEDIGHAIHAVAIQSELRRFQEAFEHGAHGMCITDETGTIEHVNRAFADQTGFERSALVGEKLSEVQSIGPEDVFDEVDSLAVDGNWKRDLLGRRGDGTDYVAEQTIAPIRGEDGSLEGFVVIQTDVTDRRQRETAIRREREMLDSLLETSPTGIVVLSPAGDILRANNRAAHILDMSEAELTGLTYDEPMWLFTDEDGDPLPDEDHPFRRVLEEGAAVYDRKLRMERPHADPIWVAVNGAPLFDPDGDLERVVFAFDDISAIKEAQRQLAETNRTLDALFQAAPVAIIAQDLDETITHWNEGAEEIFGWSADEAVGRDRPPFVTGEAVAEYRELFERTTNGESFTGIEIRRERKDGTPVDLHLSAAPIRDADEQVMGIMAIFADLTDQKRRERQLRQFREAVEHAGHSVMITDTDGIIQYVNPAFEEQTGYTAQEALGRTPAILNSGAHDESFFAEMWGTLHAGEVWEHEIINRRKDGTEIHVDQTIAPVFGESGDIEYFVSVNHDITERTEKERALERQNQRLEEFASVVSHDLRNPLNVAAGNLDLLDADSRPAERLADALERMDAIIDDVLTLAREGDTAETVEPIDVGQLARESWAAVDGSAGGLTVEGECSVRGDPERTRRIIENLCRNAVEHAGPDVAVRVGPLDSGGFYLEDDGPGIEPADAESVFESGFTTADSGNGLGLAIVRRLAEAQGWSVAITEGCDGGARFEFCPTGDPTVNPPV